MKVEELTGNTSRTYKFIKRAFDILASIVMTAICLVPMAAIAVIIMIKDPGSPFYVHKRVGLHGKEISVLKFRTMRRGADTLEDMLTPGQLEEYKREYKLHDDPRLIGYKEPGDGEHCFGAVLRRTSLDELPQIFYNVLLKGDMSFVGPRPVLREEMEKYYSSAEQEALLSVKPGITGYWQTHGRSDSTYETGERQRLELHYVENRSLALDLRILFRTVSVVVRRGGDILKEYVLVARTKRVSIRLPRILETALLFPLLLAMPTAGTSGSTRERTKAGIGYRFIKRAFDILASAVALIALSPLFLVISILIVLDDPKGAPIFVQTRVGKGGKEFRFYKFRSMVVDAEERLDELMGQNEMDGPVFKIKDDPRITRMGKFIRRTSIDELPQLVNVLLGDMSIVGPRPPLLREVEQYSDYQRQRLSVTPGLTCYWQVRKDRNLCSFDEWVEMDLQYIRERSIGTDLKIIFKTFGAVLGMNGV